MICSRATSIYYILNIFLPGIIFNGLEFLLFFYNNRELNLDGASTKSEWIYNESWIRSGINPARELINNLIRCKTKITMVGYRHQIILTPIKQREMGGKDYAFTYRMQEKIKQKWSTIYR